MASITKDLGIATAYGYAVSKGYTGTEAEFAELMASYATVAQAAQASAESAAQSKEDAETAMRTAVDKALEATTAASTATTKASEASASANSASTSAQTATTKASEASGSATTATTKASEASASATAASGSATAAQAAQTAAESAQSGAETAQAAAEAVLESIPADYSTLSDDVDDLKSSLETKYVGFRRYLTASDDCFALPPGVYGIGVAANQKPANLPSDFTSINNGFLIVLESQNNSVNVALCVEPYPRRIWLKAYEWVELAKTSFVYSTVESYVNNALASFATGIAPELIHFASDFYATGDEIATNKNQYKWLADTGVRDITTSYPDWYVTDEITINPLSFYYLTASARSAGHYLYAIYDASGNILAYEEATSWDIKSIDKKTIFTPYGATKMRIASVNGASGAALFSALETSINQKWGGLKWAAMGDSLTAVNARTTMHYHDYIANDTGITVVNLGAGGTGYKKSYGGVSGFVDRVDTIPLDADVVTIFGSGNDYGYEVGDPSDTGTETLCGCINTTISRIFERITTCNLGIITPAPWQAFNPADNTNWMAQYSAAIVQICKNWGIPCLDLYHCSNLRPWDATFRAAAYSKDDGGGIHPDETGHKLIAPRFEAFLDELLMH